MANLRRLAGRCELLGWLPIATLLIACSTAGTPTPAPTAQGPSPATDSAGPAATPAPARPSSLNLPVSPAPTLTAPVAATPIPTPAGETALNIATGGTGGAWVPLGEAFAAMVNRDLKGVRARAVPGRGPRENLGAMDQRAAQIAFTTADIAHYAYFGVESYKDRPSDNFNAFAALSPDLIQVVAAEDAKIASLRDLRGKRVAVGPGGSGNEIAARQLIEAAGLTYADLTPAVISFGEMAIQFQQKQIDAMIIVAAAPNSVVREAIADRPARALPIPSAAAATLKRKYGFFLDAQMPADTYRGQNGPVSTLAIRNLLVVRKDLDPALVYQLAREFWSHREELAAAHDRGKEIVRAQALAGVRIPVHPGATKFYDEK